jgi:SAM-dependent methyltransferase
MVRDRWHRFYAERDYDRCAYLDGEAMVNHAVAFFESVGVPETVLSVGCGPAVTEFELAERYPETEFACVDVARTVVADDRALARERGLENVTFLAGALPELPVAGRFDLVYCVATLYFVADVAAALRQLYGLIADGGHLVVSYPTAELQSWVREQDAEKRAFFELVDRGENLTTATEIERLLGAPVREYGAVVGADDALDGTVVVGR